jgi:ribosomal protein L11 methyltransferase
MWQVSIVTRAEAEEAVAALLERTFDHAPSVYRDERTGALTVTAYPRRLPEPARPLRRSLADGLERVRECGLETGRARITIKPLRRQNWAQSWKRHFKPISIGGRLLIKPGWSRRRCRRGQRVVILDPGLSFGTGHHPTTLFCLEQLVQCRRPGQPQSLLDVGAGSGILAIAAAKLGYRPVAAFDSDPEAVRAARENVKKNKVRGLQLRRADLARQGLVARRRYDVVCANLTADLLLAQARKLGNLLQPGGQLVIAGIRAAEFPAIEKKLQRCHLTLRKTRLDKGWKSGRFVLSKPCDRSGAKGTTPPL